MVSTRIALLAASSLLTGVVRASLEIISPGGPDLWWVADSSNVISWSCEASPYSNFSIYLSNTNVDILTGPIGIIAVQENYDCSKEVTQQQADQPAATGYSILFTNPLNTSQIWAQSEAFEIKALGAAYPTTTVTGGSSSATGSSSGSASTSSSSSGSGLKSNAAVSAMTAPLMAAAVGLFGVVVGGAMVF
ncbi:hypothetical protein FISHEDRAFT_45945 [Fistulina hepatica ATCC 64428]|uniref:Uncharacterized protein n=1 Tax=Fistulina hepatica ATCC 64428 TaxID=1128425 RepID=A0A0D7A7X1_9AGAR|nr:hypothetical protein FISHEDRAFT_45945 [Fistulina hepatica ATCC 64428]